MTTATTPRPTKTLAAEYRGRLLDVAREVRFPADIRLFHEGGRADRFWILQSGIVSLDMRVPGHRPVETDTLGAGDLLGWSWLFPPYRRRFGAQTAGPVRALEFDAEEVRRMCAEDPAMGHAMALWAGSVATRRLQAARTRLLDLYAPYGSGSRG